MAAIKLKKILKDQDENTAKIGSPKLYRMNEDILPINKSGKIDSPKVVIKEIRKNIDDIPVCFEEIIDNKSQRKCEIAVFTEGLSESDVFGMFKGYFNQQYPDFEKFADISPMISAGIDFSFNKSRPTIYGDPDLCNVVKNFIEVNKLDALIKMIIVLEFH